MVLQENLLFRGTIRENIAAARPDATLDEVVEAARLAGADEFIDRLPHAYETMVEEGASQPLRRPAPAHRHRARPAGRARGC